MQTISITCKSCFNLSSQGRNVINPRHYRIGSHGNYQYFVYLYFMLPMICPCFMIQKAELIQYPMVPWNTYPLPERSCYSIYPSKEFVTPFHYFPQCSCLNVGTPYSYSAGPLQNPLRWDMTELTRLWYTHQLENRGFFIVLNTSEYMQLIAGPSTHGLEPLLTITIVPYQECPIPLHSDQITLPITVSILDNTNPLP